MCSECYTILSYDIALEEIESIVKSLKSGKSSGAGADAIVAEHLKYGGAAVIVWLKRFLNAVISLEHLPPSLCYAVIVPIYKGKGHDPLNPNSYRGISLTSGIAKVLEKVILRRMLPVLHESGLPHISQTAYISGRSCVDGLFVTNETSLLFAL